jgi:hypothetical protein
VRRRRDPASSPLPFAPTQFFTFAAATSASSFGAPLSSDFPTRGTNHSVTRVFASVLLTALVATTARAQTDEDDPKTLRLEAGTARAHAWERFRAGDYAAAERSYREAAALDGGLPLSRLGLAWSLARLGHCRDALPIFESLSPNDGARDGARLCRWELRRAIAYPDVAVETTVYTGDASKSYAVGATGAWATELVHRWWLSARYRYLSVWPTAESGLARWDQHEGYASLGWARRRVGVSLHYALVSDGSGYTGLSHHVGVSARWSPLGDGNLDGAASIYGSEVVVRGDASWSFPLGHGFSVRPGIAVQWHPSEALPNGFVTLAWDRARGGVFAGGKYGEEYRPAYLSLGSIANLAERIEGGAWAGGRVQVGRVALSATYVYQRLRSVRSDASVTDADAHSIVVGSSAVF